jgi:hypothetical protein
LAGERALAPRGDGVARALEDAGGKRLGVAGLEEEVGAEEGALGLLDEEAGVPAVRQVGRREEAQAPMAERTRFTVARRDREPLVQRPALVGLVVAEADPAQALGRQDRRDGGARRLERLAEAGVHQERLVVCHQELVELHPVVGRERGDAIDVGGDLADGGHRRASADGNGCCDPATSPPRERQGGLWRTAVAIGYTCRLAPSTRTGDTNAARARRS